MQEMTSNVTWFIVICILYSDIQTKPSGSMKCYITVMYMYTKILPCTEKCTLPLYNHKLLCGGGLEKWILDIVIVYFSLNTVSYIFSGKKIRLDRVCPKLRGKNRWNLPKTEGQKQEKEK